MQLDDRYSGTNTPFEGDLTLSLRTLPAGAQITRAIVTLIPVAAPAQESDSQPGLFAEIIEFDAENQGTLIGRDRRIATRINNSNDFVTVNFHTRRKLIGFQTNANLDDATLQIDIGGSFVELSDRYTIKAPDEEPLFLSNEEHTVPGLLVQQFMVTQGQGNPEITTVVIQSAPTNVSLRLGDMPPFWTQLGEITSETTSNDFAAVLNAYLSTATPENGFYIVPLVVHSDAIARLDIRVQITYTLSQPVLPPHLPEATLPFTFGTVPAASQSLLQVSLPAGAIAQAASARIQGEFKPTRIALGPIGTLPPTVPVLVSPDCSLAQPIWVNHEIAVTAIDLLFSKAIANLAGLQVSIQTDADGKPSGTVEKTADVVVGRPVPPEQTSWGSATLTEPLRVRPMDDGAPRRYWLVLQSQLGEVEWRVEAGIGPGPGLQCSIREGTAWRVATVVGEPQPLSALFRLRHQPEQFTIPVQLQIGEGETAVRRRLDEFAPLGRIEFQFDFTEALATHLSNAEPVSSCGRSTLLSNGDFSVPASDDAAHKLFDLSDFGIRFIDTLDVGPVELGHYGFITSVSMRPIDRINLSTERFVTLSLPSGGESDPPVPPARIDCGGVQPTRTRLDEIIRAINTALGEGTASILNPNEDGDAWQISERVNIHGWCSTIIPTGWQGINGQILRLRGRDDRSRYAVLFMHPSFWEDIGIDLPCFPPIPAAARVATSDISLQQRVVCKEGCTYLLQFNYGFLTDHENRLPARGFTWQLVWLDAEDNTIRIDEAFLPAFDSSDFNEGGESGASNEVKDEFCFHEVSINAPPAAVNVDVRFEQSVPGGLLLDAVALTPTTEALNNGRFQLQSDDDELLHWEVIGDVALNEASMVELRGSDIEPAILTQQVEVRPGSAYRLQVLAQFEQPLPNGIEELPLTQRSRLELVWAGSADPVTILLDEPGFPNLTWSGESPVGVTTAEIRIIQPYDQPLQVTSGSLVHIEMLEVPLTFLSEAPGELVVSNIQVEYDPPAIDPPQLPIASNSRPANGGTASANQVRNSFRTALSRVPSPPQSGPSSVSSRLENRATRRGDNLAANPTRSTRSNRAFTNETLTSPTLTNEGRVALLHAPGDQPSPVAASLQTLPDSFAQFTAGASDAAIALLRQGFSAAVAGHHADAISAYRQVIIQADGQVIATLAQLLLGDAHARLNEHADAITHYNAFIAAVPNTGYAHYQRGVARATLGDRSGALQDLNRAAERFRQLNQLQNHEKTIRQIQTVS